MKVKKGEQISSVLSENVHERRWRSLFSLVTLNVFVTATGGSAAGGGGGNARIAGNNNGSVGSTNVTGHCDGCCAVFVAISMMMNNVLSCLKFKRDKACDSNDQVGIITAQHHGDSRYVSMESETNLTEERDLRMTFRETEVARSVITWWKEYVIKKRGQQVSTKNSSEHDVARNAFSAWRNFVNKKKENKLAKSVISQWQEYVKMKKEKKNSKKDSIAKVEEADIARSVILKWKWFAAKNKSLKDSAMKNKELKGPFPSSEVMTQMKNAAEYKQNSAARLEEIAGKVISKWKWFAAKNKSLKDSTMKINELEGPSPSSAVMTQLKNAAEYKQDSAARREEIAGKVISKWKRFAAKNKSLKDSAVKSHELKGPGESSGVITKSNNAVGNKFVHDSKHQTEVARSAFSKWMKFAKKEKKSHAESIAKPARN